MTRAQLHAMVDSLPDDAVDVAGRLLERAADPAARILAMAPVDDEPYTPDEQAADIAAMREPAIPWEQAKRELTAD
jgi:hypothetical protein